MEREELFRFSADLSSVENRVGGQLTIGTNFDAIARMEDGDLAKVEEDD